MAYAISPGLCEPCQGIINSAAFRDAIECLKFVEASSREGSNYYNSSTYREYESRMKYTGGSIFMLYRQLLESQQNCSLCKLILECRTSIWGDSRMFPDSRPHLQDCASPDTELIYGIDLTLASAVSSASLVIGTAESKLALVHISLPNKQQIENVVGLQDNPRQPLRLTTISQIKRWLVECIWPQESTPHRSCIHVGTTEKNTIERPQRPKRLLRILDDQTLIVREITSLPVDLQYATLSHCWGSTGEAIVWCQGAVSENGEVDMGKVPKILCDTTALLWALDIHYLWVDAICIDQDSQVEWLNESVKMGDIYQQGYLNISAIASQNGSDGLFLYQLPETKILLPLEQVSGARPVLLGADPSREWNRHVRGARLSERGWVPQERLLSPRTIHVGKGEVFWECNSLRKGETSAAIDRALLLDDFKTDFSEMGVCNEVLPTREVAFYRRWRHQPYEAWRSLLQVYSRMHLSKASDKLVAIAGVANRLARYLELPYASYIAGHWKEDLPGSLLWRRVRHGECFPDRAPSWSWARWDGPIEFVFYILPASSYRFYTRITATCTEDDNNSFESEKSWWITVQGPLICFNFTDERKHQPTEERKTSRPTEAPAAPFEIPAWTLNWDDKSSTTISADQQYYALCVMCKPRDRVWPLTYGLVLNPTGVKRGQLERVGMFKLDVSLSDGVLAHYNDLSKIPEEVYSSFDPDYGFEIELV